QLLGTAAVAVLARGRLAVLGDLAGVLVVVAAGLAQLLALMAEVRRTGLGRVVLALAGDPRTCRQADEQELEISSTQHGASLPQRRKGSARGGPIRHDRCALVCGAQESSLGSSTESCARSDHDALLSFAWIPVRDRSRAPRLWRRLERASSRQRAVRQERRRH